MRIILFRILLVVFTFFPAMVACELALRTYGKLHQSYLVEMWRYGRNHKEFVADARSHVHIPNTHSLVMGKEVSIDPWGLRGPNQPRDISKKQILVLGDSITFGFGVEKQQAFPSLLEAHLKNSQVWNAGVGNYNSAQEFAALKALWPIIEPKEVILAFFINDLEPTQRGSGSSIVQSSLLLSLTSQIFWSFASKERSNFLDYYRHWANAGWNDWARESEGGIQFLREKEVPLKVLLIPELRTLNTKNLSSEYAKVRSFFQERNIAVCDGEKFFPPEGDYKKYWAAPDDSHPNAEGHRILADAIISCFY